MSQPPDLFLAIAPLTAAQDYPAPALYMVATPIGNLADITLRALHVLQQADTVFCEDTRQGAALLRAYGLHKPMLALHQHNEHQATTQVLARLESGQRVAYVSDAGTPGISDPGARLCATVQDAGWRVLPLPGASSVTALLGACGALANDGRFVFVGFLPAKGAARQHTVDALMQETRACVLLEAPHRMAALAQALAPLGQRRVSVGRELTKRFETIATLTCADLPQWLTLGQASRGEWVLALHGQSANDTGDAPALNDHALRLIDALNPLLGPSDVARVVAQTHGVTRRTAYDAACLRRKNN
ncbi:MAG: 16S rRNA (cytidine(1402)-2'-O)-methyltransferase [Proteobacteria bacterium]|nr:16S rRNA (cytidine(1402)-2'-O)-methyltransferase [Pseudomonadota bacterium]